MKLKSGIWVSLACGWFFACGELQEINPGSSSEVSTLPVNVQTIFTNNCAFIGCHAGPAPVKGQNLSETTSYGNIVNVPSQEIPSLMRIKPGDADNSYLVRKIEGVGIQGERMPEGGPYLSQAEIDTIRSWVQNGALAK